MLAAIEKGAFETPEALFTAALMLMTGNNIPNKFLHIPFMAIN
jgi:hypothetical protein